MKLLDSSVIIAYANADDALHEQAKTVVLEDCAINELVFAEVANVLQKKVKNKEMIMKTLNFLAENTAMLACREVIPESLKAFSEHYPKLSLTDATLLLESKELGLELATFDEELLKLSKP